MREVLTVAASGHPSLTVFEGHAGIGKSRLVLEVERLARESGHLVLHGECLSLSGGELPYAAIGGALRRADREALERAMAGIPGPARAEIVHVFPDFGRAGPAPAREPGPERFAQTRLFGSLLALVRVLTDAAPVLLVIEDFHWADASSRDFVRFLMQSLNDERIAVVTTVRREEVDSQLRRMLGELERDARAQRRELLGLSRAETAALLEAVLGEPAPDALAARIYARSEGNPLYAEELLAAGPDAGGRLPARLRDVLDLRLEPLSGAAVTALRALAVIARPAGHDLVARVAKLDDDVLVDALLEALDQQLLVADEGGVSYRFRHALLREAVYAQLLLPQRRLAHAAVAAELEELDPAGTLPERAHHWEVAGDPRRALVAAAGAGLAAERVHAYAEALTHFERLLRCLPAAGGDGLPGDLDLVDVLTRAGEAARFSGDYDRAQALCRQALGELDHAAAPLRAARLYERLGRYQPWNMLASLDAYRAAQRLLPSERVAERARLLGDEALSLTFLGRWPEARDRAAEALALARDAGATSEIASAKVVLGVSLAFLDDPDAGERELREGLALAGEVGSAEDLGRAYLDLAEVLRLQGRLDESLALMREGEERLGRLGAQESFGNFMAINAAGDQFRLGHWPEADAGLKRLAPRRLGPTGGLLHASLAARLATARGAFEAAGAHFARAQELCDDDTPPEYFPALYTGRAELALWTGELDAAQAHVLRGLALTGGSADPLNTPMLFSMAARARADAAAAAVRSSAEQARCAGLAAGHLEALEVFMRTVRRPPPEAVAHLATCRAEVARAARRSDAALWEAAGAAWERAGQPYPRAYAAWREAEGQLHARGSRRAAQRAATRAHTLAERLEARPLLDEIVALERNARFSVTTADGRVAPRRQWPADLTHREVTVLRLLAAGDTNSEIADRLVISVRTAEEHVRHILAKLGVRNRMEAATAARRLGVLDEP